MIWDATIFTCFDWKYQDKKFSLILFAWICLKKSRRVLQNKQTVDLQNPTPLGMA